MEHNSPYKHEHSHGEGSVSHEQVIIDHLHEEVSGVIDYYCMHEKHEHVDPVLAAQFAEMARDEFSHAYMLKQSLMRLNLWHKVPQETLDLWEEACNIVGFAK